MKFIYHHHAVKDHSSFLSYQVNGVLTVRYCLAHTFNGHRVFRYRATDKKPMTFELAEKLFQMFLDGGGRIGPMSNTCPLRALAVI